MIDLKWHVHKKTSRYFAEGNKDGKRFMLCLDTRLTRGNNSMQWGTLRPRLIRPQPKSLDVNGSISMSYGLHSCIGEWYPKGEARAQREWDICILSYKVRKLRPDSLIEQTNSLSTRCGLLKCLTPRGSIPFQLSLSRIQRKRLTKMQFVCHFLSDHGLERGTYMQLLRNKTFYQLNSTPLLHGCYIYIY